MGMDRSTHGWEELARGKSKKFPQLITSSRTPLVYGVAIVLALLLLLGLLGTQNERLFPTDLRQLNTLAGSSQPLPADTREPLTLTGSPKPGSDSIYTPGSWQDRLAFPVVTPGTKVPTNDECCLFGEQMHPVESATAPNLFFVGTQKGGTTFLSQLLSLHPGFYQGYCPVEGWPRKGSIKEMHFFDMLHINQTLYEQYVSSWHHLEEDRPEGNHVRYEASPAYMRHSYIPCRLRMLLPEAKVVILLRDPVDRAESVYRMNWGLGNTNDTFVGQIVEELAQLRELGCTFRDVTDKKTWGQCFKCDFQKKPTTCFGQLNTDFSGMQPTLLGTVLRGMYAPMLAWWLSYFPLDQVLIFNSAQMQRDSSAAANQVIDWSNITVPFEEKMTLDKNGELRPAIKLEWPPGFKYLSGEQEATDIAEGRQLLEAFFEPLNEQLYTLMEGIGAGNFERFPKYNVTEETRKKLRMLL